MAWPKKTTVTSASVGSTIDTGGTLIAIGYQTRPTPHMPAAFQPGSLPTDGYFCLIDKPATGLPHQLYNLEMYTNGGHSPVASSNSNLLTMRAGTGISLTNLVVQACPPGAQFVVTTDKPLPLSLLGSHIADLPEVKEPPPQPEPFHAVRRMPRRR
jgi:hypothetical protein